MPSIETLSSNVLCGDLLVEVSKDEVFAELINEVESVIVAEQNGEKREETPEPGPPVGCDDRSTLDLDDDNDGTQSDGQRSYTLSEWLRGGEDDTHVVSEANSNSDESVNGIDDRSDNEGENKSDNASNGAVIEHGWDSGPERPVISEHCEEIIPEWDPVKEGLQDILYWSGSEIAKHFARAGTLIPREARSELEHLESKVNHRIDAKRGAFLRAERLERSVLVDTPEKLVKLLDRVCELDLGEPQIVIDCEGFSQEGSIDVMELFVLPDDTLHLIGVYTLGDSTWTITATCSNFCLREFLASSQMKKIMWDLRMDAHYLKNLYDIRLAGIVDSSLWTVAYRIHRGQSNASSRFSVETACKEIIPGSIHSAELQSLLDVKERRSGLPFQAWRIRPLPEVLLDYAADVKYMGVVYQVLQRVLGGEPRLLQLIEDYTEQEIEIACSRWWPPWSEKGADCPWSGDYFRR